MHTLTSVWIRFELFRRDYVSALSYTIRGSFNWTCVSVRTLMCQVPASSSTGMRDKHNRHESIFTQMKPTIQVGVYIRDVFL